MRLVADTERYLFTLTRWSFQSSSSGAPASPTSKSEEISVNSVLQEIQSSHLKRLSGNFSTGQLSALAAKRASGRLTPDDTSDDDRSRRSTQRRRRSFERGSLQDLSELRRRTASRLSANLSESSVVAPLSTQAAAMEVSSRSSSPVADDHRRVRLNPRRQSATSDEPDSVVSQALPVVSRSNSISRTQQRASRRQSFKVNSAIRTRDSLRDAKDLLVVQAPAKSEDERSPPPSSSTSPLRTMQSPSNRRRTRGGANFLAVSLLSLSHICCSSRSHVGAAHR